MATRKEILSDLSKKIADGNIREAYRDFEELPVVDQIAVSISPGVGDAIAAYEVAEFGRRAKTNIQDKDRLGAAGNIALSGLAGISLIPLLRFLRGAKAVAKTGTKVAEAPKKTDKPPVEEPLQLSAPKDQPEIELPEVLPFVTKPVDELAYGTTQPSLPMQSKARKFLHGYYKKLDPNINELSPEDWVKTLTDPNNEIPLGELRLLNVLDELNQIHPKLIKEAAGSEKISKGFLDNYMERQQRDALQVRGAPPGKLESPDTTFANEAVKRTQQQKLYFVRGVEEQRNRPDHFKNLIYPDGVKGNDAYAFDGVGTNKPQKRLEAIKDAIEVDGLSRERTAFFDSDTIETIEKGLKELNIKDTDTFADIFRVQSDFMKEIGDSRNFVNPKTEAEKVKKILRYNKFVDEINPIIVNEPGTFKTMTPLYATENIRNVGVKEFTLEPKDIEAITGRSYLESLDKTPEEIFFMTESGLGGKQKYFEAGKTLDARAKAYFKDLYKNDEGFIKLQNGARILKKAVVPKMDFSGKFKIDPYFEKTTTNEMKLPVRFNVLQAYKSGADGVHIGKTQAITEGSPDVVIEKYTRGEKEIDKILNELGITNKKGVTTKISDTGTEYDGTYLKFTDEVKKAIEEQGINAFKLGGPVDIDKMLAEL
jgi:coenzyme F420-reducing hydrogenase delta subunit